MMDRLLLIAEDAGIIEAFTKMLSSGYTVYSVASEQEGIDALKKDFNAYAAVLLEIRLTRESGFIFSHWMREYSSVSTVPMIAISGTLPKDEDMDCIEQGFFDLLSVHSPQPLVYQRIGNAIRAKDSLSLSEVEKMLKELPSCIFLKDAEGRYVFSTQYWNHLDTEGDPNWTIRGKSDLDIRKDKENAKKAMEADRRILETGEGTEYVIEENQDGITDYLQLIKRPVYDDDGRIKGIIALINNITDYQILKQQLEERVKTDEHMVTAMAADYRSIYYADLDKDECVCVRKASEKISAESEEREFSFGRAFEEYAENHVVEADREAFLEFVSPENIRARLAEETMISHRYLSIKNGEEQYEMLRIADVRLVEDRKDHTVHAIAVGFTDVDRQTREQMEQNRALAEALERAEEANAAKTAFLSSMSHEIRTPMNAIIGLDNIALQDPNISVETRDELEKIGSSARHLLAIINDILDMSRIESGRMVIKEEAFSLQEMLKQINIIIGGQCEDKRLTFETQLVGEADEYFIGDDLRIRQILINILGNGVKFTDSPGTVSFTAEELPGAENGGGEDRILRFTMKDTGVGIDEAFLPKLFEPFAQEDSSTTNRYGGSGLGMALTRNMVDLMGGSIRVESEKGVGSTFIVDIPLKRVHHMEQEERTEEEPDAAISIAGLHVLIAEDVEINAEILIDLLEMEEITAEWAENGKVAVELFSQSDVGHFDVILMDMRMPVMDGLHAAREIRELDRPDAAKIPIIALTANAFEEDVEQCLKAGMNAHLAKPLDIDAMRECLKEFRALQ